MLIPPTMIYFVIAALAILLIPGPAVIYIATRSLREGRSAGLASVVGVQLADLTHALLATVGLSAILLTSAIAFDVVKFVGAGYLIYLGLRAILSRHENDIEDVANQPLRSNGTKTSRIVANGFLVDLLNPKTALFFYAFLPQFVTPSAGAATYQILLFGITFVLLGFCTDSSYAILGSVAKRSLSKISGFKSRSRYMIGGTYIALGLTAVLTTGSQK
jgi:threonine/homoserine/homoserine lactone efflux protein